MAAPISYADELDPFLALELPSGWVRGLLEPLSGPFQSDDPLESALFEALTGSKPDSTPTSNAVIFTYLAGYDPGIDRPMDSERQLVIEYAAEQDAFGVRAAFDEGLIETAPDARDWLERAMPRVEREMDHRRRSWVALSDIHGLGQQEIGNLNGEYESLDAVASATEAELTDIPYVTDDLASEVVEAAEQFDGTVPDAHGDRAADCADDPLVVDTSDLRPFSDLFEN
jgi:hypothetical protein